MCVLTKPDVSIVLLSAEPSSIEPNQTTTIKVTVATKNNETISGASVMLSSSQGGKLTPVSGTTNSSGQEHDSGGQHNIHMGDRTGIQIKDSFVQTMMNLNPQGKKECELHPPALIEELQAVQ